ncbi:MAG: tRNA lysidine(34) synthetase TilS [Bacteroidales bacterium]|nr:tRNA lysidine(34) synthetase TilS [Bacteroidales bacterium]
MIEKFKNFIESEHLYAQGQQVLLAVSGGRDSVTLVDLVSRCGIPFGIAHCNFHLRPGDCDRDESFVRQLASRHGVKCYVVQFDTERYAADNKLSIEDAARRQRYEFFEKVRKEENYDLVATAHHRDDSIETFFINLMRGTGIAGLHGILPRNGCIIRPLLSFSRAEIDEYVGRQGLDYVDDYTNDETIYLRNRVRLQLLPLFRQLSPSFDSVMDENLRCLRETEEIFSKAVDVVENEVVSRKDDMVYVDIDALRRFSPIRTYLFEILRPFGFSSSVVDDIIHSLNGISGKQFFSSTHRIVKDRASLVITPLVSDLSDDSIILSEEYVEKCEVVDLRFSVANNEPTTKILLDSDSAWFDMEKLHFPLTLRHWRHGDRIEPFGMTGSRKVSDIFSDKKLSLVEKERVWLLCDNRGEVLWIVGIRASRHASVTDSTKRILKVGKR